MLIDTAELLLEATTLMEAYCWPATDFHENASAPDRQKFSDYIRGTTPAIIVTGTSRFVVWSQVTGGTSGFIWVILDKYSTTTGHAAISRYYRDYHAKKLLKKFYRKLRPAIMAAFQHSPMPQITYAI